MPKPIISVEGLRKVYHDHVAVDGIRFSVMPGEIFGLLGPNGAGKTTTLECLEGLRVGDGGRIRVNGIDPARDPGRLFKSIGVQLQVGSLPGHLRVSEATALFAAYHGVTPHPDMIAILGLDDLADTAYDKLSAGQKRRVELLLAVLHRPSIVFLDEPTAGLDVSSRNALHRIIRTLRDGGTTIVLSTHDMAEAERLADRVAIMIRGRIAVIGSPRELTSTGDGYSKVSVRTREHSILRSGTAAFSREDDYAVVFTRSPGTMVGDILQHIATHGDTLVDLRVERPSLEERFLEMVQDAQA